MMEKKLLNVGGNNKTIPIPSFFDGWRHDLLDIDPTVNPDILCDAREIWKLPPRQYDAVYCSHNLEHFNWSDVQKVLKGIRLVLKKEGFAAINVPNLMAVMRYVVDNGLDLCDQLYTSISGQSISPLDVIYGYGKKIEASGENFFCHMTGFSRAILHQHLAKSGFLHIYVREYKFDIYSIAFKREPTEEYKTLLGLDRYDFCQPLEMENQ